ncbi:hypothetical protein PF003_g5540 [Phytophthora fragariae]|nr:hypothetical protein PF003_g5540 [Phytophthora fragariae]
MHATKQPRTLLLASRILPCSRSDAATSLDAAVACKANTDQSLATPPTPCTPPTSTNLPAGRRCRTQNQYGAYVSTATNAMHTATNHEPCFRACAACVPRRRSL